MFLSLDSHCRMDDSELDQTVREWKELLSLTTVSFGSECLLKSLPCSSTVQMLEAARKQT